MENAMGGSDCSSGCESGWTLYLQQSFLSPSPRGSNYNSALFLDQNGGFSKGNREYVDDEEEEEDLSMVSDASSGPPHFQEDENCASHGCFYLQEQAPIHPTLFTTKKGKRQKSKETRRRKAAQDLPSYLDDTASSPFFNFSNNNLALANNNYQASMENILDFSQGYSTTTTHFEGKSAFQEQFGFFHSPVSGAQLHQNQWFEEKRMGMR